MTILKKTKTPFHSAANQMLVWELGDMPQFHSATVNGKKQLKEVAAATKSYLFKCANICQQSR